MAAGVAPAAPSTSAMPSVMARLKSSYVVRHLPSQVRPVASSSSTRSVKVPPMSKLTRMVELLGRRIRSGMGEGPRRSADVGESAGVTGGRPRGVSSDHQRVHEHRDDETELAAALDRG